MKIEEGRGEWRDKRENRRGERVRRGRELHIESSSKILMREDSRFQKAQLQERKKWQILNLTLVCTI